MSAPALPVEEELEAAWGPGGGMRQMFLWSPGPRACPRLHHHPGWGFKTWFWVKTENNRLHLNLCRVCKLKIYTLKLKHMFYQNTFQ